MKFAPVMPASWMPALDGGFYHLVNSHTVDLEDRATVRWLQDKGQCGGHWVILDNGAYELGEGQQEEYFRRVEILGPDLIVCPDKPQDMRKTLDLFNLWMNKCLELRWHPFCREVMIVPQGGTPQEWLACFDILYGKCRGGYDYQPFIGVPKYLEEWNGRIGIVAYLLEHGVPGEHVHILGIRSKLGEAENIARMFPEVRGVDSSWPVAYGLDGGLMPPFGGMKHVIQDWDADYGDRGELIRANIATCRRIIERGGLRELPF